MSDETKFLATALDYAWVAVLGLVGIVYKSNSQRRDEVAKTAAAALTRDEKSLKLGV